MTIPRTVIGSAPHDDRPTGGDRQIHKLLAVVPFGLLALSLVLTLAAGGRSMAGDQLAWMIAVVLVTAGLRLWWRLGVVGPRLQVVAFVVNLALTVALISISPLFGVYAFVGYLDAVVVFAGPGQVSALIVVGSLNALAQSGGPVGAYQQPLIFAFLLLVNATLAVVMVHVDRHRQRTVTRLERTLAELAEANRVNAALQAQLVEQARASGVGEERQRLSREIHDTVAQDLIALLRQIEAASEATTLHGARVQLGAADATARAALAEARRAVGALASPRLDATSLPDALAALVTGWSQATGIAARFASLGAFVATRHDADLLRICQEALANVARHAGASQVEVELTQSAGQVKLCIRDDGGGFNPADPGVGHGLSGMRKRVAAAGGELLIDSSKGGGCTISAAIPL